MEENMLEKKENEVTNNNNKKNGIIAVLVLIIIALIGAVVYFAFIKKDDKPIDNKGGNNWQINDNTPTDIDDENNKNVDNNVNINDDENNKNVDNNVNINDDETNNSSLSETKIELYVDEDKDQSVNNIKFGNKIFEIKLVRLDDIKSDLYLSKKKVETIDYDHVVVSVVNKYLVVEWPGAQGGSLALGYINEEGDYFSIYSAGVEALNVYFENGRLYCDTTDDDSPDYDTKRVELILNGSNIVIKEIK